MADTEILGRYCVRDPIGEVVARFETFEEAALAADETARRAKLPGLPGVAWDVVREPLRRRWRRPRVMHKAYPSRSGPTDTGPGGDSRGVREPRRPRPGSSSGAVELELPE